MGILYQILHQTYKLRHMGPKTPSRIGRFFGAVPTRFHAGTHISLDFLFPYSTGHESLRNNYVIRLWVLHLLADHFTNFLFFQTTALAPGQQRLRIPFKLFKKNYRALTGLAVQPAVPGPSVFSDVCPSAMRKLFQYMFINEHVMSTYRLVELSAYHKKNVPHKTLLTAAFIALGAAKLKHAKPAAYTIDPNRPGEFGRAIGKSQVLYFSKQRSDAPRMQATPPSAAWIKARRLSLAAFANAPEHAAPTSDTLLDPSQQPTFHRYTLSGQGLDHSLTTPVRGLLNKLYNKGRTPRNKQIYRTGVFWCLWLTIITIVGPFYVFYGFTFMYTHLYIFPLAILARMALVATARFFNVTAKQLWLRLYYLG